MTDRNLVRLARSGVAVGGGLALVGTLVSIGAGHIGFWWASYAGMFAVYTVSFAIFVWLVVPHQPRNAVVRAMAASSLGGFTVVGYAIVILLFDGDPNDLLEASRVPADSPAVVAWPRMFTEGFSIVALFVPFTFGLLLFPDGTLPSRRWRPVAVFTALSIVLITITHAWGWRPTDTQLDETPLEDVAFLMLVAATILSLAALVVRFRSSTGVTRQQFKWIVWGAAVCVPTLTGIGFLPDSTTKVDLTILGATVAMTVFVSCYGIAVGRYRLYDIDVVISRTVVFVGLVVFISSIYVVVVVGIGKAFGGSSLWLSVLATAAVAVVFEPVRARLQRFANRLVYGHRATPYEVLAGLAGQLATTEHGEELLRRLAVHTREGTGARRAVVFLVDGGRLRPVATDPLDETEIESVASMSDLPGVVVSIEHQGELLGALAVEELAGAPLSPSGSRLVEDLAGSAALVIHKLRLDEALAAKATELEESRLRLLRAQDDERRRLERDLHDGVEQQVVAIKVRLGLARQLAAREGTDQAVALIDRMTTDTQDAIEQIRSLASGIYPALLDADGLAVAIPALAGMCPLEVRTRLDVTGRHPLELEGAIYFCVSEALTNASKHAAGPIRLTVGDRHGELAFSVADCGPGFEPARQARGSGLDSMADRLDALGGKLTVTSSPGAATTITGRVPIVELASVRS